MMWREARITGGSMVTTYNPWRTLGNGKECATRETCHLIFVGVVANMVPIL
jgi:hypothetical protein